MKYLLTFLSAVLLSAFALPDDSSIHYFKVKSISGGTIDFSKFKGKKILIVNTASKCGYTPQYTALQKLADDYKDKLVVVGFPASNFNQELSADGDIQEFCKVNYGVKFPLASKVSVKGEDIAPIYQWLTSKTKNGVLDAEVKWNFNKFLLDENGKMIAYFPSKVTPDSEDILKYVKINISSYKEKPITNPSNRFFCGMKYPFRNASNG